MVTTIDTLLRQQQLDIGDICERSGLQPARVEAILTGRWLASPKEREQIAGAFNVGVQDIAWGHFMSPRNIRYHQKGLKEDFGESDRG